LRVTNYGFIIDNRKCIGCHACTVACKAEHDVPVGVNRTWVKYIEKGTFPHSTRLFSVLRCNHCDNAPCVDICPVTALYRRPDGIVDFDNRRCIGCRACMQACPYDALYIDPETRTAAKCNYCAHRVDRGLQPACVNVCPTQAIISGDLDDPESEISRMRTQHQVTVRKPEKETLPALFYIDGDVASLNPAATEIEHPNVWSSQVRGVGHYARLSQQTAPEPSAARSAHSARRSRSKPSQSDVRVLDSLEKFLSLGDDQQGILDPKTGVDSSRHSRAVAGEVAKRTYDAPQKGTLWGWQVTAYIWTKAIASGAVLVPIAGLLFTESSSAGINIFGAIVGLVFLALTGALLAGDLDQPGRFLYVLLRPQWRSWLVRGAYIITAYGLSLALWLMVQIISGQRPLLWGAIVFCLAVLTAVYTAFLFAQAKARDFWQSPILGIHMLVHAWLAGGAVFLLAAPFTAAPQWLEFVRWSVIGGLAVRIASDILELAMSHPTADGGRTAQMIVSGHYRHLYRNGAVGLGIGVPFLILLWPHAWLCPLAGIAVLLGIYISDHIWVCAPQRIPLA
jgi:Fe-S-cluster-containing dehydrogenase component/formate-dependent nitrite reductase membrane component NrfD